jgi:3-dehydrosphinganine reductase
MKENLPQGKVIVITGGSSGIGYATADNLLGRGAVVCLVARNNGTLAWASASLKKEHPDGDVQYYEADVSDRNDVKIAIQKIAERNGRIDWMLNVAGTAESGRFESQSVEVMQQVMNTNYWGAAYFTLEALPYLKQSPGAAVAFVSSIAGYLGLFGYTHYVPSKFAVTGLAECLRMEFIDYNIPVSIIYPPDTRTPMYEREQLHALPECKALSLHVKPLSPEFVAARLVEGLISRKFEIYCNGESRLLRILRGLVPAALFNYADSVVIKCRKEAGRAAR